MQYSDVLIGTSLGDESKGRVTEGLVRYGDYDLVVRFNGSCNAGHTIMLEDGRKVVTHQIPTGILKPGLDCLIGPACLVDLNKLRAEIQELESLGFDVSSRLYIAYNAHLISAEAVQEDCANDAVGTTHCGIAPTVSRKVLRIGQRICDAPEAQQSIGFRMVRPISFLKGYKRILFEGAQGFGLDIDHGDYPYVTSTSCMVGTALASGVNPHSLRHVYGVCKLYDTYVGSKKFQPEDDDLNRLGDIGHEYGATTGRRRQTNWLNMDLLDDAITSNGVTHLSVGKCDVVKELGKFQLYRQGDGKLISFSSVEEMIDYIKNWLRTNHPGIKVQLSWSPHYDVKSQFEEC